MIIRFLKYLNKIPVPLTIKHYVLLGKVGLSLVDTELTPENWLILRNNHPRYSIPEDRETWIRELALQKDGQDARLHDRVAAFVTLLEEKHIATVYSIGSGGGVFEYFLKQRMPNVKIVASEVTQEGVDRLRRVFTECDEVRLFDALNADSWKEIGKDQNGIVFIYRNEHEFSDEQWREMFAAMHESRVRHIFLGFMYFVTVWSLLQAALRILRGLLRGEVVVFAGYVRNYIAFERFWRQKYVAQEVDFPNCRGFYLARVNK